MKGNLNKSLKKSYWSFMFVFLLITDSAIDLFFKEIEKGASRKVVDLLRVMKTLPPIFPHFQLMKVDVICVQGGVSARCGRVLDENSGVLRKLF